MGASVGIPAASLCINRRLYYIASAQTVSLGRREVCSLPLLHSRLLNNSTRNCALSWLTVLFAFSSPLFTWPSVSLGFCLAEVELSHLSHLSFSEYIVQGHRFNIFEDIGCFPALYNTLLTYFISNMWPIVIGLISAGYCSEFGRIPFSFSSWFIHVNFSSFTSVFRSPSAGI